MTKNPYNPKNQYTWTKKEDDFAIMVYTEAIKNKQKINTATLKIYKAFGETRTEGAIYARWKDYLRPKQEKRSDAWTEKEDNLIIDAYTQAKQNKTPIINATQYIYKELNGTRTEDAIYQRWLNIKSDKPDTTQPTQNKEINPHDNDYIAHVICQYQEEGKPLKDAYQALGVTLNRDPLAVKHLWENKLQHQQTKTVTQTDVMRTLNAYVGSLLEKEKQHLREENKRLQKELDEAKNLLQKFTKAFSGIVSLEEVRDIIDTQVDTPELIISSNGLVERKHPQIND